MATYWDEYSGAPSNVPRSAYPVSGQLSYPELAARTNVYAPTITPGYNTPVTDIAASAVGGTPVGQTQPVGIGAQPGSTGTTYFPGELASLMAQMLGMQMSDAQFYANLGFQREQAERMAKQWREEFDWSKQESIAGMLYNQQLATGYMQKMPFLTESGASIAGGGNSLAGQSIWNARPDLKAFYDQAWGAGSYSIDDAVNNWLSMTDEPDVIAAGRDANAYAAKMGLPTVESAAVKDPGDMQKTVERERMEGTLGLSYGALLQGLSGPENYVQKAQTEAALAGSRSPEWFKDVAQRTGLPEYGSVGYNVPTGFGAAGAQQIANMPAAPATGIDPNANTPEGMQTTIDREQMEESQRLQYAAMLASKKGPNDWTAYWNNTQGYAPSNTPGWIQGLMQGKVGPAFQAYGTAPIAQQPPVVPDVAPQGPVLLDENNVDPLTGLGYNALGTRYWKGGPTVVGEYGPEIVNAPPGSQIYNAQETQQMTQPQYQMPSWVAPVMAPSGPLVPQPQQTANTGGIRFSTGNAPATKAPNLAAAQQALAEVAGTGSTGLTNIPYGHKITYAQWAAMPPSVRAGLQSNVEAQGGFWEDYMDAMQKSWPTRKVNPTTYF